jgi:[acyl-carrier-protein] S-malonyltransferase
MKAFIFPGQGSQFPSMGFDLYSSSEKAKKLFHLANEILNFDICSVMFEGNEQDLKQTNITQPSIFLHSTILSECLPNFNPDMVAGHSLGEFSSLVAAKAISFEDGLKLVMQRANAMQIACKEHSSTMAAIIGLESEIIEKVCDAQNGIVVTANYNAPNQIVISGETTAIKNACTELTEKGAKRAIILPVGGAFHSPIMDSAKESLKSAINNTEFQKPICPIYQNVCATAITDQNILRDNLIEQLTAPVKWYQTIQQMILDGAKEFYEVGPGNVLIGLNRRINRDTKSVKATI